MNDAKVNIKIIEEIGMMTAGTTIKNSIIAIKTVNKTAIITNIDVIKILNNVSTGLLRKYIDCLRKGMSIGCFFSSFNSGFIF